MNDAADHRLAAWLAEGPDQGPPVGLERALAATHRTSQRPGWSFPERWLPMQLTFDRGIAPRPLAIIAVVGLVLAALIAAFALAGSSPRLPDPLAPAANGWIAVNVDGRIVLVDPDDRSVRPLAGDGTETRGTTPTFALDGRRLAFWSRADLAQLPRLVVTDLESGTPILDLDGASLPGRIRTADRLSLSPDGSRLALILTVANEPRLFVLDVATGQATAMATDAGSITDPAWSPDGSLIAYRRSADGTASLDVVGADGSGARTLTTRPDETSRNLQGFAWSPTSTRLAFQYLGTGGGEVATVDVDGVETPIAVEAAAEFNPAWSPDGTRLAFMADEGEAVDIAAADGSGRWTLTRGAFAGTGCPIAWSPDGAWILGSQFGANCGPTDAAGLMAVNVADPARTITFDLPGTVSGLPSWQRLAP